MPILCIYNNRLYIHIYKIIDYIYIIKHSKGTKGYTLKRLSTHLYSQRLVSYPK